MQLMMTGPLNLPMSRGGSGTSWFPDDAPMYGTMRSIGSWGLMAHGIAFVQASVQGGPRGDQQIGSINWGMLGVTHALAGGRVQLRSMLSLDAFTVGNRGYPLLLQSGESYAGVQLSDRQHPHDLFMEVATVYDRAISNALAVQLYVAPVGEPALGPVAFPHRASAVSDPFAPITHHWQDATHISFGVITAALYTRTVKLETSLFNGREPDGVRTNFDLQHAKLDSRAVRITYNPASSVSLSVSGGQLKDVEPAHQGETIRRVTASILLNQARRDERTGWSAAVTTGANSIANDPWSRSMTLEGSLPVGRALTLYTRLEGVEKSADELVLPFGFYTLPLPVHRATPTVYRVFASTVGAVQEIHTVKSGSLGVGVRFTRNVVPSSLAGIYGSHAPLGGAIYLRWRPSRMNMGMDPNMDMSSMKGMPGR